MRNIIFTLFLIASAINCQAQCGYDSIGVGIVGIPAKDTAVIGNLEPRCTRCPTAACVAWSIMDNFDGHLYFHSPSGGIFSVQVTQNCNLLLLDTCGIFPPPGIAGLSFDIFFSVIGNAQVMVCGNFGDMIYIDSKSTTSPQEELSVVLADLDSCGGQTSILEPLNPIYQYYRWSDGVRVYPPLAPGFFWRRDVTLSGKARIIRVE